MNLKILLYGTLIMLLTKCSKTETITEIVEVEKIVTEIITQIETVTVTNTVYVLPEEYSFTRDGVSTVFYSGQTARLGMATELKSAMNNTSYTQEQINNMIKGLKGRAEDVVTSQGRFREGQKLNRGAFTKS